MKLDVARDLVRARTYGRCEGCGAYGLTLDVHHRQARGNGGVSRMAAEVANDVRNLLGLCRACHDRTERAADLRETEAIGWRIPKWVDDPLTVPASLYTVQGHGWWYLTEHGGYRWSGLEETHRLSYEL